VTVHWTGAASRFRFGGKIHRNGGVGGTGVSGKVGCFHLVSDVSKLFPFPKLVSGVVARAYRNVSNVSKFSKESAQSVSRSSLYFFF
jgi:hypothetical protein